MLASTFRWLMMTPLGSEVAPDVKMISATSSRAGVCPVGTGGAGAPPVSLSSPRRQTSRPGSAGGSTSSPTSRTRASTSCPTVCRKPAEAR